MGERGPAGPALEPDAQAEAIARRELRRRVALLRAAVALPLLFLVVIGLVVVYRATGRPLGDAPFWLVLAPVVAVLAAIVGHAILAARRG